jgi:hypothetical protein
MWGSIVCVLPAADFLRRRMPGRCRDTDRDEGNAGGTLDPVTQADRSAEAVLRAATSVTHARPDPPEGDQVAAQDIAGGSATYPLHYRYRFRGNLHHGRRAENGLSPSMFRMPRRPKCPDDIGLILLNKTLIALSNDGGLC